MLRTCHEFMLGTLNTYEREAAGLELHYGRNMQIAASVAPTLGYGMPRGFHQPYIHLYNVVKR